MRPRSDWSVRARSNTCQYCRPRADWPRLVRRSGFLKSTTSESLVDKFGSFKNYVQYLPIKTGRRHYFFYLCTVSFSIY